jgi:hypothetical protein
MNTGQDKNGNTLNWIPVSEGPPADDCLAVCKTQYGRRYVIRAFYAKKFEVRQDYDNCTGLDYNEDTGDYYLKEGWYESAINWDDYSSLYITDHEITHWMPVPGLPTT